MNSLEMFSFAEGFKILTVTFDNSAKSKQKGKDNAFNKWCWEKWLSIHERIK